MANTPSYSLTEIWVKLCLAPGSGQRLKICEKSLALRNSNRVVKFVFIVAVAAVHHEWGGMNGHCPCLRYVQHNCPRCSTSYWSGCCWLGSAAPCRAAGLYQVVKNDATRSLLPVLSSVIISRAEMVPVGLQCSAGRVSNGPVGGTVSISPVENSRDAISCIIIIWSLICGAWSSMREDAVRLGKKNVLQCAMLKGFQVAGKKWWSAVQCSWCTVYKSCIFVNDRTSLFMFVYV